jgi:hypothetical protein
VRFKDKNLRSQQKSNEFNFNSKRKQDVFIFDPIDKDSAVSSEGIQADDKEPNLITSHQQTRMQPMW